MRDDHAVNDYLDCHLGANLNQSKWKMKLGEIGKNNYMHKRRGRHRWMEMSLHLQL